MTAWIESSEQITPEWLTENLRAQNALPKGHVTRIEKDCSTPFGATVCKLNVTFSDDAPASAPRRLFMKLLPPGGSFRERGSKEIQFYQAAMNSDISLPIPTCFHAAFDPDSGMVNLLLEDLSDTHEPLEHEIPPTEKQCYQLMEVLAQIHAFWWDSPRLGVDIGTRPTEQSVTDDHNEEAAHYHDFADYLGDRLMPSRRAIYADVIDKLLPVKSKRFAAQKNVTLAHGDAHAWNFMYPKSDGDTPRLLDWEALGVNIGAYDLAYMMAIFWHPERRKWLEKSLVRHYHTRLSECGVTGYTWDDCWYDYRLSVINLIFMPVWWRVHRLPAFLWWHRLERIMMAYEDLRCAELLD